MSEDIRLGFGYEQAAPGLYLYDASTGLVVCSEDVAENDAAIAERFSGHAVTSAGVRDTLIAALRTAHENLIFVARLHEMELPEGYSKKIEDAFAKAGVPVRPTSS